MLKLLLSGDKSLNKSSITFKFWKLLLKTLFIKLLLPPHKNSKTLRILYNNEFEYYIIQCPSQRVWSLISVHRMLKSYMYKEKCTTLSSLINGTIGDIELCKIGLQKNKDKVAICSNYAVKQNEFSLFIPCVQS